MGKMNKASERPLSPHLQIYKPQISSVLSISHRISGIVLSLGLIAITAWLFIAAYYPASYVDFVELSSHLLGRIAMIGFTLAFTYHLLSGIRHMFWDMGYGFELKNMAISGWAVVISSLGVTAFIWCTIIYGSGF